MTGPAGAVPGAAYTPFDAPVEQFLAHLDRLGLQRGVLVTPSVYGPNNTVLLDALQTTPNRLRGVAVLDPNDGDDVLAKLDAAGVRACRAQDNLLRGDHLRGLLALQDRVHDLGWHIELWSYPWAHRDLLRAAARRGRLLLDHLGLLPAPPPGDPDPTVPLLRDLLAAGDVWVTLSGAYRLVPGTRERDAAQMLQGRVEAVLAAAPDRVVWGTDWPYVNSPGPTPTTADHQAVLAAWLPDPNIRQPVLVDNPARLYRWPT